MIRINYDSSISKESIIANHTINGGVVCFDMKVGWDRTGYVHLLDYIGNYLVEDGENLIFDSEFEFYPISLSDGMITVDVVVRNVDYYLYGETDPCDAMHFEISGEDFSGIQEDCS